MTARRRRPGAGPPGSPPGWASGGRPAAFYSDGLRLAGLLYSPPRPGRRAPSPAVAHQAAGTAVPQRRTEITLEAAEAIVEFRPEAIVDRLSPRPLLLVAAGEDLRVPVEESARLYERARDRKTMVVLEGAAHHDVYQPPVRDRLLAAVLPWLTCHLPSA